MGTPPNGFDPSQLPGVTDFEAQQLGQMFESITSECEAPSTQSVTPTEAVKDLYKNICGFLRRLGAPMWIARLVAAFWASMVFLFNATFAFILAILAPWLAVMFKEVLGLLDTVRKELDPNIASAAVMVLNELLGTDFTTSHLATGIDVTSHLERAGEVGGLLHDQLLREFKTAGDVTPDGGRVAARRFSGLLINFGTVTGLLATIGGLFPAIHLDEIREIGEEVARNLGLGRIHRQVLKPVVKTLIGDRYQEWLNQQFHPTQFKVADLVNPFNQNVMDTDLLFKSMDLLGYSQDKITELLRLHQKRLTLDDLDLLQRYGQSTDAFISGYVKTLGFPEELQDVLLKLVDLRRADAAVRELVAAMEQQAADGHITVDDLSTMLDNLPLGPMEKRFLLARVQFKTKVPHAHLTVAQAQKAFEEGVWDLDALDAYFVARGYSADDVATLELLTLLALAKMEEAKKVAQFAYDKKKAAAEKKGQPIPPPPAILSS